MKMYYYFASVSSICMFSQVVVHWPVSAGVVERHDVTPTGSCPAHLYLTHQVYITLADLRLKITVKFG